MASLFKRFVLGFRDWVFYSKTFCCCIPVRFGVTVMAFLSMVVSGLLSIVVWFEVARASRLYVTSDRPVFIVVGVLESLLFIASVLGFAGAIVRKQLFVVIYAYFLYVHVLLNVAVAAYFLFKITVIEKRDALKLCQEGFKNSGTQAGCADLLKVTRNIYIIVSTLMLSMEIYCALIVGRYVHQIKGEKRTARASRIASESTFNLASKSGRYSKVGSEYEDSFDGHSSRYSAYDPYEGKNYHQDTLDNAPPPIEEGYGGGTWTHQEILEDEKKRMRERGDAMEEHLELEEMRGHPASTSLPNESEHQPPVYGA